MVNARGDVVVRNLTPDEWTIHRHVRLSALQANPEAFGSTLRSEEQRDELGWRHITDALAWFAFVDEQPAGMVRLWVEPETKPVPEIIALWVHDRCRDRGVARELMRAALAEADRAAGHAQLWVVTTNQPAVQLYRSLGFTETGVKETLPDGRNEVQMAWSSPHRS